MYNQMVYSVIHDMIENPDINDYDGGIFNHPGVSIGKTGNGPLNETVIIASNEFASDLFTTTDGWLRGEPMWADPYVEAKYGRDVMLQVRARWQEWVKNHDPITEPATCHDVGFPDDYYRDRSIHQIWVQLGVTSAFPEVLGWRDVDDDISTKDGSSSYGKILVHLDKEKYTSIPDSLQRLIDLSVEVADLMNPSKTPRMFHIDTLWVHEPDLASAAFRSNFDEWKTAWDSLKSERREFLINHKSSWDEVNDCLCAFGDVAMEIEGYSRYGGDEDD